MRRRLIFFEKGTVEINQYSQRLDEKLPRGLITLNNSLKNGLQALSTTLCACRRWPSQAIVTSVKSSSSRSASNWDVMFAWKLFHLRQNCWSSAVNAIVDAIKLKCRLFLLLSDRSEGPGWILREDHLKT